MANSGWRSATCRLGERKGSQNLGLPKCPPAGQVWSRQAPSASACGAEGFRPAGAWELQFTLPFPLKRTVTAQGQAAGPGSQRPQWTALARSSKLRAEGIDQDAACTPADTWRESTVAMRGRGATLWQQLLSGEVGTTLARQRPGGGPSHRQACDPCNLIGCEGSCPLAGTTQPGSRQARLNTGRHPPAAQIGMHYYHEDWSS